MNDQDLLQKYQYLFNQAPVVYDEEWAIMQQKFSRRLTLNNMQPKDGCRLLGFGQQYRTFFEPNAIYMDNIPLNVKTKVSHAVEHPYVYSWQVIVPTPGSVSDVVEIFNEFHRADLDSIGIRFIYYHDNQLIVMGHIWDESAARTTLQPCIEQMQQFNPSIGHIQIVFSHERPL